VCMQHLLGLVIVMNSNAVQHYCICHLCVFYSMVFYFFFSRVFFYFVLGSGSSSILTGFTMHSLSSEYLGGVMLQDI